MKLWQRQATNPEGDALLQLLDCAFHLKFVAYHDRALREQLSGAWAWCFKTNQPSRSLALRSNDYAKHFAGAS